METIEASHGGVSAPRVYRWMQSRLSFPNSSWYHLMWFVFKWAQSDCERAYWDIVYLYNMHKPVKINGSENSADAHAQEAMCGTCKQTSAIRIVIHTNEPAGNVDRPNGRVTAAWAVIAIVINISKDHKLQLVLLLWRWMK